MKIAFTVAGIVALVAAAAWPLVSSEPKPTSYTVEVRDVAGAPMLVVVPEVAVTARGHLMIPEVVATANMMPEVVVRATAKPELAAVPWAGAEAMN
jgi:hypothetical protein